MIYFNAIRLSGLKDIELPIFGGKQREPYQVTAIDGLGPPELELTLAEIHTSGGVFVDRRANGRVIVIRMSLNPDYSVGQRVSDLRHDLYGLLSPGVDPENQSITFSLLQDNVPVIAVEAYVKGMEIVLFDKKPQVQLTLACLSPYLVNPSTISVNNIPESSTWSLENKGLAPTGIDFGIQFKQATTSFTLGIFSSSTMTFNAPSGDTFRVGDRLYVDTDAAKRFVGLYRNSGYINFMDLLTPESKWLTMYGGVHVFVSSDPVLFDWLYFRYAERYWGV